MDSLPMSLWYPALEEYTIESHGVAAGEGFAEALADAFYRALEQDHDPRVCVRLARRLLEEHPELHRVLRRAVDTWGAVFIRGDNASPKDACSLFHHFRDAVPGIGVMAVPGTMNNACIAWRPEAALALLVASERVLAIGDPRVVWLRKPIILASEVRVFVKDGKPRLVSWYYDKEPLDGHRPRILRGLLRNRYLPFAEAVAKKATKALGTGDLVLDIGHTDRPLLVEATPFPRRDRPRLVDPVLFREDFWEILDKAVDEDTVIARYPVQNTVLEDLVLEAESHG